MYRLVCSDGTDLKQNGKCVVAYKLANQKDLDLRTIQDDCYSAELNVRTGESALAAFLTLFGNIIIPACRLFKEYGLCRIEQKNNFLHGLHLFEQCIESM